MAIERFRGKATGRSKAVGFDRLLWVVANAADPGLPFREQVDQTLASLDQSLRDAGSDRAGLLSVQVFLAKMEHKPAFDTAWVEWIGPDPAAWPQRACVEAGLDGGLLIEIVAVAARR
jgi:enamine deaminase RidA (YjgF/YER057c/UK114 family)